MERLRGKIAAVGVRKKKGPHQRHGLAFPYRQVHPEQGLLSAVVDCEVVDF